jgi:putative glutamine transport system substrate-binding protein
MPSPNRLALTVLAWAVVLASAACQPATSAPPAAETAGPLAPEAAASPVVAGTEAGLPPAEPGSLLRTVQDRGRLVCGTKYDVPTFGYLSPETNKVEGFDIEVCRAIARHILGDPEAVEIKEALSRNRIPFLNEGVVDVVASTMTINEERLKEIDFSNVYFIASQALLLPVSNPATTLAELKGQRIGTVKGSTSEQNINAASEKDGLGLQVLLFDTYSEAVAAMDAGRVDAVTTDDIILYGFMRQQPDKWKVVGGPLSAEPYGIGVPKGQAALLSAVNDALAEFKQSGSWQKAYQTWITAETVPEPPADDWRSVTVP